MTAVAVVGAGPSGVFAADGLTRKLPDARIDVIDRLPTPFGLVRSGVAPDHQGTKAIQRQFDRTLAKGGVRFVGNVELDRDVTLAELEDLYDAVIVATGAPVDAMLGIPGDGLSGVVGSGAFVGWLNGHPDHAGLNPNLDSDAVVVIGNGNVALDVCRVLAKTATELADADIIAAARARLAAMPLRDIWLMGRRGPMDAAFTVSELKELGELSRCAPAVDPAVLPDGVPDGLLPTETRMKEMNLETLHAFADDRDAKPVTLHMGFHARPVEILGNGAVRAVRFERNGETFDVPCGLVVTAIGYRPAPLEGLALDGNHVANTDGRVAPGRYVVGWAKRGPSGTIPTNRADSLAVVDAVVADLADAASDKPGGAGLDALLAGRGARPTTLADWHAIDAAERARAEDGRPREKFTTIEEMLGVIA